MPSASAARTLGAELSTNSNSLGRRPTRSNKISKMRGIGLHHADMAGDHGGVEFAQEVVLLLDEREFLGREVAQRMDRPAGAFSAA